MPALGGLQIASCSAVLVAERGGTRSPRLPYTQGERGTPHEAALSLRNGESFT